MKVKSLSRVRLFETPWTAAYQVPPSMGFSRQEYWSGVPLPSPFNSKYFLITVVIFSFTMYYLEVYGLISKYLSYFVTHFQFTSIIVKGYTLKI